MMDLNKNNNLSYTFRLRVKEIMRLRDLKQKDLAALMGISQAGVATVLSGKNSLNLKTIEQYSAALNMHPLEFFGADDSQKDISDAINSIQSAVSKALSPKMRELIELSAKLDDDHLDFLIVSARGLGPVSNEEKIEEEA